MRGFCLSSQVLSFRFCCLFACARCQRRSSIGPLTQAEVCSLRKRRATAPIEGIADGFPHGVRDGEGNSTRCRSRSTCHTRPTAGHQRRNAQIVRLDHDRRMDADSPDLSVEFAQARGQQPGHHGDGNHHQPKDHRSDPEKTMHAAPLEHRRLSTGVLPWARWASRAHLEVSHTSHQGESEGRRLKQRPGHRGGKENPEGKPERAGQARVPRNPTPARPRSPRAGAARAGRGRPRSAPRPVDERIGICFPRVERCSNGRGRSR